MTTPSVWPPDPPLTVPSAPPPLTADPVPQPEAEKPKVRKRVEPAPESALEAAMILHQRAKEQEAASKAEAEQYKTKIRDMLLATIGEGEEVPDVFDIPGDAQGRYPGYTMQLRSQWYLPTEEMKLVSPETYVYWAKQTSPSWVLAASRAGKGRGKRK